MDPWTAVKQASAIVTMPPAPVRDPSQWPFIQSCLTANDKGDNDTGTVYRYPDICFRAEESPGKPQLRNHR